MKTWWISVHRPSFAIRTGLFCACSVLLNADEQNLTFFNTANHMLYFVPILLFVWEFSFKQILDNSRILFVFCYLYRSFLNDIKLGILILNKYGIKIQNDVIIRKQSKTHCQYFSNAKTFGGNSEFKTGDATDDTINLQTK